MEKKPDTDGDEKVSVSIRFPKGKKLDRIRDAALKEDRSFNSFVVNAADKMADEVLKPSADKA